MAVIVPSLPNNLTNGTTADATQVMANFNAIVSSVNSNAANSGVNTNISQITGLTSPLAPNQGGTGLNSLPANGVIIGEGTNNVNAAIPGAAGQVLVSNGMGVDPSFGCPYAVGDLYITTNSANPNTRYTGTAWVAYAAGQVLIGVGSYTDGSGNAQTITAGQQLGEFKHTLSTTEMPSHNHTDSGHTHTGINGSSILDTYTGSGSVDIGSGSTVVGSYATTASSTANIQNTGGGASHNNIQPSIGVYIWQRTS